MTTYSNWFDVTGKDNFEFYLSLFADKPNLRFLQVGAFTGDASVWMLDNILTDESSTLTDVDTWNGSDETTHKDMDFKDVYNVYIDRTEKYVPKRLYYKGTSTDYFMNAEPEGYDFIYIDGDHTAQGVISDAIMGWQYLKPGGIMAFDDYAWTHDKGGLYEPKPAINFFCWAKQLELKIIGVNGQVWVHKNDN